MAAVIGFLLVSVVVTATVATSVVSAMGATSMTQASVQSQAAAEAGIAQAQTALAGTCTATTITGTNPTFTATIYRSNDNGASWVEGCPSPTQLARVRSTGTAQSPGTGGQSRYDQQTVEAIFSASSASTAITPGGPAIYSFSGGSLGNGASITVPPGTNASVMLYEADMNCNGAFTGPVTVVVQGNFTSGGGCSIVGDLWATGSVSITGGAGVQSTVVNGVTVGGNVHGNSVTLGNGVRVASNVWSNTAVVGQANVGGWISGATVNVTGSIGGGVWARAGDATIAANVTGPVSVAGTVTIGNAGQTLASSVRATGNYTQLGGSVNGTVAIGGSLSISGGTLAGGSVAGAFCRTNGTLAGALRIGSVSTAGGCHTPTAQSWWGGWSNVTVGPSSPPALTASPTLNTVGAVPNWVDFGASAFDYTSQTWQGFTIAVIPAGACGAAQLQAALTQIGSAPGVVDARSCTNGLQFGGGSEFYEDSPNATHHGFKVRNDLAIIANTFVLSGSARFVGQGGTFRLWLINPDVADNDRPTCSPGQSMSMSGGFTVTNLKTMVYTPCSAALTSSTVLTGQIYAEQVSMSGAGRLNFEAIGLPGYNINDGTSTSTPSVTTPRDLLLMRNIDL